MPSFNAHTENDVELPQHSWETKTVNLGLGVASLLNDSLDIQGVFQNSPFSSIDCSFEVTTGPESQGIFVVLSQLSAMRRWANGSCRDYLKINYANYFSAAICGPVGEPGEPILSFDSSIGLVKVQLHLDNSDGRHMPVELHLRLVLTSYFDCSQERDGFSCTSTNERCIPTEYVGDGLINCDVPSCRDEGTCVREEEEPLGPLDGLYRDSVSITLLIGLASFLSTGLLFGLLLWFCLKRNLKQRLSGTASTPELDMELSNVYGTPQAGGGGGGGARAGRSQPRHNLEPGGSSSMEQGGTSPSADPPPRYDILFPDK